MIKMLQVQAIEGLSKSVQKDMEWLIGEYSSVIAIEDKVRKMICSYMVSTGEDGRQGIYTKEYPLSFEKRGELVATINVVR